MNSQQGLEFTFKHQCENTLTAEDKIYFAFTYPWTLNDNKQLLDNLQDSVAKDESVYFERTTLIRSSQNRNVEIVTISSATGKDGQIIIDELFPDKYSPHLFSNKKGIFISARVHPGQLPSSFVMNGFLKFIVSNDPVARALRENCVFYIVPIINPDGVENGNYRSDSEGQNLNRYYLNPTKEKQPEIFGIKTLITYLTRLNKLSCCIDLHAHAGKKGCFIYGNYINDFSKQLEVCLFPKLMSINSKYFDYDACNFSETNMYSTDKGDTLSKQGAARVAIFKDTGLHTCWTLECNYNTGRFMNKIYERGPVTQKFNINSLNRKLVLEDPLLEEATNNCDVYDPNCFEEVGRGIAQSLSDFFELRLDDSRVSNSPFRNITTLKMHVSMCLLRMVPFRFDNGIRKILISLNSEENINSNLVALFNVMQGRKPVSKTISKAGNGAGGPKNNNNSMIKSTVVGKPPLVRSLKKIQGKQVTVKRSASIQNSDLRSKNLLARGDSQTNKSHSSSSVSKKEPVVRGSLPPSMGGAKPLIKFS